MVCPDRSHPLEGHKCSAGSMGSPPVSPNKITCLGNKTKVSTLFTTTCRLQRLSFDRKFYSLYHLILSAMCASPGAGLVPPGLVCLGCCKDASQTEWLKQQEFVFSQSWSLEVRDRRSAGLFLLRPLFGAFRWSSSCCGHTSSPL